MVYMYIGAFKPPLTTSALVFVSLSLILSSVRTFCKRCRWSLRWRRSSWSRSRWKGRWGNPMLLVRRLRERRGLAVIVGAALGFVFALIGWAQQAFSSIGDSIEGAILLPLIALFLCLFIPTFLTYLQDGETLNGASAMTSVSFPNISVTMAFGVWWALTRGGPIVLQELGWVLP